MIFNPGRVLPRDMDTRQWGEFLSRLLRGIPRYDLTDAERTAGVTPVDYSYPPGHFRRYGAEGDGTTDDRAAIQAALNSNTYAFGDAADTYLVTHSSTTTINSVAYRYCLSIPAGVTMDLRGGALKLSDSQNSSVVALLADDGELVNAVIDGNRTNQTSPATGETSCVLCFDVDRIRVHNVRVRNVREYAGRFLNARSSTFTELYCEDSYGDGWSFGTTGAVELRLFDCFIDKVYAENCEGTFGSLEGNGTIFTTVRCQVGSVHAKDCAGGNKIQNSSSDCVFESLIFDGDDQTYGSANSGNKIQGTNGSSLYVTRCAFNSIVSLNCYGNGLVVRDIDTVQIGTYSGSNNGSGSGASGSDQNDVEIALANGVNSNLCQIGKLTSDSPTARGVRFSGGGDYQIETVQVRNATNEAVQDTSTGRVQIGRIIAIDDQGTPTTTYAYRSTGSAQGYVGAIETNLTHSTSQSRVSVAAANYKLTIGEIRLGSTDLLNGVTQLTNAAGSTSVTCGHIWRDYVGGTSDYFHPNHSGRAVGHERQGANGNIRIHGD